MCMLKMAQYLPIHIALLVKKTGWMNETQDYKVNFPRWAHDWAQLICDTYAYKAQ